MNHAINTNSPHTRSRNLYLDKFLELIVSQKGMIDMPIDCVSQLVQLSWASVRGISHQGATVFDDCSCPYLYNTLLT